MTLLLLILMLLPSLTWAVLNGPGDFQIWQRNFVVKHFAPKWSTWLVSELRLGDTASEFYSAILHAQLYYAPRTWIVIGPGYEQVWTKEPSLTTWKKQYIPLADAIFRARLDKWEIQDRNRLEYVIFDSSPFHWLYRNRFRIIVSPMLQNPTLAFFTDNEFYWLESNGIAEDRISLGLMLQWQDNWGGEVFYMARLLHQPEGWIYNNVIAFDLLFSF